MWAWVPSLTLVEAFHILVHVPGDSFGHLDSGDDGFFTSDDVSGSLDPILFEQADDLSDVRACGTSILALRLFALQTAFRFA